MADEADQAQQLEAETLGRSLDQVPRYKGKSAEFCADCDEVIGEKRRQAIPGVQLCVECQALNEAIARTRIGW